MIGTKLGRDISDFESKAQEYRYTVRVTVAATGDTTVRLLNLRTGSSFEGFASHQEEQPYFKALQGAVDRMVAFERRFE